VGWVLNADGPLDHGYWLKAIKKTKNPLLYFITGGWSLLFKKK
jgi:hypothetical protein